MKPIDSFKDNKNRVDWPTKVGNYWFYGYRYGKISCGTPAKPELILCKVRKIANGLMMTGDGQIMYKKEIECPNFIPATLPELIDLE